MAETVASILKKKGDAIWSVEPTATVYQAIAMMAEKSVGALLVLAAAGEGAILAGLRGPLRQR
jgi:CBS domain-containing protein